MNFQNLGKSGAVEGFCLVKACDKKVTAKGLPYLDMMLADSTGEIVAKFWDYKEQLHPVFEVNTLVKVRGTISPYNGVDQLRVEKIRTVVDSDNVKIEDFVASSDYSGEMMLDELMGIADNFKDEELKSLVKTILNEYHEKLLYWPAAFRLHHAMRGGLLYHSLSIVRLAQSVAKLYPCVNEDLLLAGAMIHDIGKIQEFDVNATGLASGYTIEGNLIGHLAKGAVIIDETAKKLNISAEKSMLLQHMILSHHGEPEFGAAVRPMFIEAELLSELDTLDSKVFEMAKAISEVNTGEFTNRMWALDNRKLYNHGLNPVEPKAVLK